MTAIKPRTARIPIYQGDDLALLADFDAKVTAADVAIADAKKSTEVRTLSSSDPVADTQAARDTIAAERDTFAAEAEARGVVVVLHALPRKAWRTLMNEHPARDRETNPEDYALGPCNIETLPDALLPMSIDRADEQSTIEGDTVEFLESLSDYDYYDRLFLTAFALNRGSALADPTLRLGSVPSQT